MDVVFGLVGVSIVLVIVIAIVLLWAVRSGQFEDMEGPAWRVVMDDDRPSTGAKGDEVSPSTRANTERLATTHDAAADSTQCAACGQGPSRKRHAVVKAKAGQHE